VPARVSKDATPREQRERQTGEALRAALERFLAERPPFVIRQISGKQPAKSPPAGAEPQDMKPIRVSL
jgi:hypothetical protein